MTDEEKKECKCCSELGKFFTLTASIFLGTLLAILVASALLKPKCPCPVGRMFPPGPVFERQIPMNGMGQPPIGQRKFHHHQFKDLPMTDKVPANK